MKKHITHAVKIVLFLVVFIFLIWAVTKGTDLGIKKASEYVVIPLIEPLDSSGISRKPDSVHIVTYADNLSAKAFSTRNTTYPFSAVGIDTTKDYGDTLYWFVDQIQDIDGTAGNFELAIMVTLFCDKLPTTTRATVQVVDDSLNKKFGDIQDDVDDIKSSVEPTLNRLNIYVDTGGSDDSSGLTWNTAVASLRIAESKCTGADEYFIYIAPGNYTSQCCTVNVSNVHILGSGWENTIINTVSAKPGIYVNHAGRGFELSEVTIVGDTASGQAGVYMLDIDGYHIHDCRFRTCRYSVYSLANAHKGLIENIHAYASGHDGVIVTGEQVMVRNVIVDSMQASDADGIYLMNDHNIAYNNYVFSSEGASGLRGPTDISFMMADNYVFVKGGTDYNVGTPHTNQALIGNHQRSFIDTIGSAEEDIYKVYAEADSTLGDVRDLEKFLGANDGYYQKLFPLGSANKDSVEVYNSGDTHLGTLYYFHTGAIIDSVRWEIW